MGLFGFSRRLHSLSREQTAKNSSRLPSISAFICVICGHEIPWGNAQALPQVSNRKRERGLKARAHYSSMRLITGALPKCWSANGPRSQRRRTRTSVQYFGQFSPSNALRTGTVRDPFAIQSFGQHALTSAAIAPILAITKSSEAGGS